MILTVNYRHRYDNYRRAGHYHLHVYTTMAPAAHIIILTTIMDDANIDLLHISNFANHIIVIIMFVYARTSSRQITRSLGNAL